MCTLYIEDVGLNQGEGFIKRNTHFVIINMGTWGYILFVIPLTPLNVNE